MERSLPFSRHAVVALLPGIVAHIRVSPSFHPPFRYPIILVKTRAARWSDDMNYIPISAVAGIVPKPIFHSVPPIGLCSTFSLHIPGIWSTYVLYRG